MSSKYPIPSTREGVIDLFLILYRRRCYLPAARLARDQNLDEPLVRHAAFQAFCRFDDLHQKHPGMGFDDAALEVVAEFGFTLTYWQAPSSSLLN